MLFYNFHSLIWINELCAFITLYLQKLKNISKSLKMKNIKLSRLILAPILLGLLFSMLYIGYHMLTVDPDTSIEKFLVTRQGKGLNINLNTLAQLSVPFAGIVGIVSAIFIVTGVAKKEFFFNNRKADFLKWGLFFAMFSISIHGFAVRIISNHVIAGTLFFYVSVVFIIIRLLDKRTEVNSKLFDTVKWLPVYFMILYTMGFTGYQKFFNTDVVMPNYVQMFSKTILADMPGGIPPFIYLLGAFELLVAILAILSLVKGEFIAGKNKNIWRWTLFMACLTFFQLSVGLFMLINMPGAVNLMIYAIFCAILFYLVEGYEHEEPLLENKVL